MKTKMENVVVVEAGVVLTLSAKHLAVLRVWL